jgi:aminoglycoside phosphotransferase family enzyme
MSESKLPQYIQFLQQADNYPHQADEVSLVQTHISFVLLAGESVYKWKKPVDFGFLNFSSLEKRKYYCEQELELNRRLCPEIYKELVTVNSDGDSFCLNGSGEIVEYGIKMARMPEEKMMGRVMAAGNLTREHLDEIIEKLVPFYEKAAGDTAIQEFGLAKSVAINVLENFEQTEGFVDQGAISKAQFDTISAWSRDFLGHEDRFQARIDAGKIRDCHGDMHSANICLAEPVQIFDCIEFNERFRYTDVAADVAFLAMDLDFHGEEELSKYFIDTFVEKSGDIGLLEMLNFYKCYRTYVRAKIALFTASDPAVDETTKANCVEQARQHFLLAEKYATA